MGNREVNGGRKENLDFPPKLNFQAMVLVTFTVTNATYHIYTFFQVDIPLPQDIVSS